MEGAEGGFRLTTLLKNVDRMVDEDELHQIEDNSRSELNLTQLDGAKTPMFLWGKNHFGQLGIPRRQGKDEQDSHTKDDLQPHLLKKKLDQQKYIAPVVACLDIGLTHVACGEEHVVMLDEKGKLFGQGSNACGQLGLAVKKRPKKKKGAANAEGEAEDSERVTNQNRYFSPTAIKIPSLDAKITKLACGEQHTLALTIRGQVYSWGQARYG